MSVEVIEKLDSQVERQVRSFLSAAPRAAGVCIEHDPHWLHVLQSGLRHRPFMLVARENGEKVNGYLPLVLVASRLFGRFLVSLPYLNRGGVVADSEKTRDELISKAVALAEEHDVQYLELRHSDPIEHDALDASRGEKVRMVLELPKSEEALWDHYSAKVRNQIRKGEKFDMKIKWGGREILDEFYDVFSVNMRDLGTPVYSSRLFGSILDEFSDRAELAVVSHENETVAGALLVHDRVNDETGDNAGSCSQVPSASCLRAANRINANMWMYHNLLLRAIERGSAEFDFGRSSEGSGTFRFKKQWGAAPQKTVWQYHLRKGDINDMRPDNPKNRRKIEMWQKMPVWLTRMVGPTIVRGIP